MTQDYLNHLFENYTGVEKWHFTADGTAFAKIEDARSYSKILGDPAIKVVANGGKLEDAVDADAPANPLGNTEGGYRDETNTGDTGGGEDNGGENTGVDYASMTVSQLKDLCTERGIELNGATKKADIIALLVAADEAVNHTEE